LVVNLVFINKMNESRRKMRAAKLGVILEKAKKSILLPTLYLNILNRKRAESGDKGIGQPGIG